MCKSGPCNDSIEPRENTAGCTWRFGLPRERDIGECVNQNDREGRIETMSPDSFRDYLHQISTLQAEVRHLRDELQQVRRAIEKHEQADNQRFEGLMKRIHASAEALQRVRVALTTHSVRLETGWVVLGAIAIALLSCAGSILATIVTKGLGV